MTRACRAQQCRRYVQLAMATEFNSAAYESTCVMHACVLCRAQHEPATVQPLTAPPRASVAGAATWRAFSMQPVTPLQLTTCGVRAIKCRQQVTGLALHGVLPVCGLTLFALFLRHLATVAHAVPRGHEKETNLNVLIYASSGS